MDIKELKDNIENKVIDSNFMIWVINDNNSSIISDQYINEISKLHNLTPKRIESVSEIPDQSFIIDDNLYVLVTDNWESQETPDNCIVVCNKTRDKNAIIFPKLEEWQIIDYIIPKLPGLEKDTIEWLISRYAGNYRRFINDTYNISIFESGLQKMVFTEMLEEGFFDTISNLTVWDLSNAILKKDKKMIKEVLSVINYLDITPLGIAKVLYTNFKNIMSMQINSKVTAKDLGMSDKQFFVVKKYNTGFYSNKELIEIMDILTNVEWSFKYNELPIDYIIDYLICRIMGA